jgi:hypothetical protein
VLINDLENLMAQKYQVSMRHRPTPIDELNTVSVELNLKSLLWPSFLDWKELSEELFQTVFRSFNTESPN